jgi:hypothetical protein
MTTLFLILFIVGVVVVLWKMFTESLGDHMPSACPRCGQPDEPIPAGGNIVGGYKRWYHQAPGQRMQCRSCLTRFKNHPNGTFVEDRG